MRNSRLKNFVIKFAAVMSLIIGICLSLGVILLMVVLSVKNSDFNIGKILIADLILFTLGMVVFLLFFGLFEFLNSFQVMEEEIEELENEVKKIKQDNNSGDLTNV